MLISTWDRTDVHIARIWGRGKCLRELKPLLSSYCKNSCKYCFYRRERNVTREKYTPEKLAKTIYALWRRRVIDGAMISSAVYSDPEQVVEEEIETATILKKLGYRGFIHLRLMPGTPRYLVWEAAKVADRIGVNIESPEKAIFYDIAPDKGSYRNDILRVLEECYRVWRRLRREGFLKSGVVTQMIVGLGETDSKVLEITYRFLKDFKLARVYYSPFEPIENTPLENHPACPVSRARRLYQAFFLMRDYSFTFRDLEVLLNDNGMLPSVDDLKLEYAKRNPQDFPVDVNCAEYWELIKVPGIGPKSAKRILELREEKKITLEDLRKILGAYRFKKAIKYLSVI